MVNYRKVISLEHLASNGWEFVCYLIEGGDSIGRKYDTVGQHWAWAKDLLVRFPLEYRISTSNRTI